MFNLQEWINESLSSSQSNYTIARLIKAISEFILASIAAVVVISIGIAICYATPITMPAINELAGGLVSLGGMFYTVETNCHFGNGEQS